MGHEKLCLELHDNIKKKVMFEKKILLHVSSHLHLIFVKLDDLGVGTSFLLISKIACILSATN